MILFFIIWTWAIPPIFTEYIHRCSSFAKSFFSILQKNYFFCPETYDKHNHQKVIIMHASVAGAPSLMSEWWMLYWSWCVLINVSAFIAKLFILFSGTSVADASSFMSEWWMLNVGYGVSWSVSWRPFYTFFYLLHIYTAYENALISILCCLYSIRYWELSLFQLRIYSNKNNGFLK